MFIFVIHKMICDTHIRTEPNGQKIYKPKRVYQSLDDAIVQAKKLNSEDKQEIKLVAYKCRHCQKYHIGRNGKPVTEKERFKLKKEAIKNMSFKIIGKINLD